MKDSQAYHAHNNHGKNDKSLRWTSRSDKYLTKPPSNRILGIKMNSNENDAMEWNDVLVEANILIYYMPKSELRMQSYGASNIATWTKNLGT